MCGYLIVDPADRDGYLDTSRDVVRLGRAAPGSHDFSVSADLVDPSRINIVGRWESRAAVEAFRNGASPIMLRDGEHVVGCPGPGRLEDTPGHQGPNS